MYFNPNLEVTQRSNYDLLNLMSDLGGLDFVLTLVGHIIINTFQSYNFYSYLISLLFVQSTKTFQSIRSTVKPIVDTR